MYTVNISKIKGKMGEKGYNITSLASELNINRNTLASYFEQPKKMSYDVVARLATLLCESEDEAAAIFFNHKLS